MTLAAIKVLKEKGLLEKVLIIAPLRVCYGPWMAELIKWTDFQGLRMALLHGPSKNTALESKADIYVINPEGLEWLLGIEKSRGLSGRVRVALDLKRWKLLGFDTLVVDELSKFKHVNTVRFKALKLALGTFSRRWGLTGSPAANGLMGLFGQCFVLDEGRTFGPYITHFRMKYFNQSYDGFSWELKDGAEKEIYQRTKPLALRMAADDYLKLPDLVHNDIMVDLPGSVRKIYDAVENDLIAAIEDRHVVAANAAAASTKCRQIANGGVYLDPEISELVKASKSDREWVNLHEEKVEALADLIEELQGSPLLVAYDFEHDLDRLQRRLGKDIPYIGGGVSPRRSTELAELWNAGKLPVLLGHPQSVAHGLNLQEVGNHICWHSLTWDYELYDQFIRRVLRQGNKAKKVFVHHIMAKNTIDQEIMVALKNKASPSGLGFSTIEVR